MAKRYDEDYEYYVPVRNYSKGTKSESTADESEISETQEVKRKRGRPPGKNGIVMKSTMLAHGHILTFQCIRC